MGVVMIQFRSFVKKAFFLLSCLLAFLFISCNEALTEPSITLDFGALKNEGIDATSDDEKSEDTTVSENGYSYTLDVFLIDTTRDNLDYSYTVTKDTFAQITEQVVTFNNLQAGSVIYMEASITQNYNDLHAVIYKGSLSDYRLTKGPNSVDLVLETYNQETNISITNIANHEILLYSGEFEFTVEDLPTIQQIYTSIISGGSTGEFSRVKMDEKYIYTVHLKNNDILLENPAILFYALPTDETANLEYSYTWFLNGKELSSGFSLSALENCEYTYANYGLVGLANNEKLYKGTNTLQLQVNLGDVYKTFNFEFMVSENY